MIRLLAAAVMIAFPAAAAPTPQPGGGVQVTLDQQRITATVGQVLTLESTVTNPGGSPSDRLVAHLNVASLSGVYVDLEDWSGDVTRTVDPIPPGDDTAIEWEIQAVNTGDFDVYVVVLPAGPTTAGRGPLVAGPPLHLTVTARPNSSAAGTLPVTLGVPALLALAVLATALRNRRTA
ncbi:MAG TPA: hypothetical protein VGJ44_00640 [Kribbellaceae bacterium]